MQLDLNSEFGARVARRLEQERVAWLTTVRASGTPDPSPVWFLWDGATILIYSKPNTQKLRNIAQNARVALSFDSDGQGGNIIVISGSAQIDAQAPRSDALAAYQAKYAAGIAALGATPQGFADTYSAAIRLTPQSVRGH